MAGTTKQEVEAPSSNTITTQIMEVTPEIAQEWLATMGPNRKVSRVNLESLIQAMEEGRWHNDGSPVRFDTGGRLIDGQHRLSAIIHTGTPQTLLVLWGVPPEAMSTLDTGKPRSRSDILSIHDPEVPDVHNVAATTTMLLRWSLGVRNNNLRNEYVSQDAFLQYFDANKEEILEATRHGRRLGKSVKIGSQQAFSLCYWMFSQIDTEDAEFFWDRLVDGQGLTTGNPIYALRELLRRQAMAPSTHDRMRSDVIIALIIKAWNAYRRGEEIRTLMFKPGGAHPERFPEPI